jgi:hypothetical protein
MPKLTWERKVKLNATSPPARWSGASFATEWGRSKEHGAGTPDEAPPSAASG